MEHDVVLYFRDQIREARAIALKDAEAFEPFIFILERLGVILPSARKEIGLAAFKRKISAIASASPLAEEIPSAYPHLHTSFSTLYDLVREARNSALHEGAFARHLTIPCNRTFYYSGGRTYEWM